MADVKYSHSAIHDLEEIGDYIAEALKSPVAALNTVGKIQDTIDSLADFPLIGAPLSSIVDMDTDYRFLVSGKYLVFYHAEENVVCIDRILYGQQNYIAILFGNLLQDGMEKP